MGLMRGHSKLIAFYFAVSLFQTMAGLSKKAKPDVPIRVSRRLC